MPPVRFELTISAGERLQTYALDGASAGTGISRRYWSEFKTVLCEVFAEAEETIDDRPISFSWGIDIGRAYVCRWYAEIHLV